MIHPDHIQEDGNLAPVVRLMIEPVQKGFPQYLFLVFPLVVLVLDDRTQFGLIQLIDKPHDDLIGFLPILEEFCGISLELLPQGFLVRRGNSMVQRFTLPENTSIPFQPIEVGEEVMDHRFKKGGVIRLRFHRDLFPAQWLQ